MGIIKFIKQLSIIKAAKRGNAEAQYTLGLMYGLGYGVSANENEYRKWLIKAAEQNYIEAQYELGVSYNLIDENLSKIWYFRAAAQGHANAQYDLGMIYFRNGAYKEAYHWIEKASEQGNSDTYYVLGRINDEGLGVNVNNAEAAFWFKKAAMNGDELAQKWLEARQQI